MAKPTLIVLICGTVSTSLGLAYLKLSGAPASYIFVNFGALLFGLLISGVRFVPVFRERASVPEFWILTFAIILALTALFGTNVEGIKRWLTIGPIQFQPGLLFVPLMTLLFARSSTPLAGLGICIAALSLAMQPDRATAGALCAALLGLLVFRRDQVTLICAAFAMVGFCVTLLRTDGLGAVEFVEGIYQAAILSGGAELLIVALGTALLFAPVSLSRIAPITHAPIYFTFAVIWLSLVVAAYVGPYPTPLLGYGTSSILGYLLCVFGFPAPGNKERAGA